MKKIRYLFISQFIYFINFLTPLYGVILPEFSPLEEYKGTDHLVKKELNHFLENGPANLFKNGFIKDFESVNEQFQKMINAKKSNNYAKQTLLLRQEITRLESKYEVDLSMVFSYFLVQLAENNDKYQADLLTHIEANRKNPSCAAIDYSLDRVMHSVIKNKEEPNLELYTDVLVKTDNFKELKWYFEKVSKSSNDKEFNRIMNLALKHLQDNKQKQKKFEQIYSELSLSRSKKQASLTGLSALLARGRCINAKKYLLDSIKNNTEEGALDTALSQGEEVAGCLGKRNRKNKLQFYDEFREILDQKYGYVATSEIDLIVARDYWRRDEFAKTRDILNKVIQYRSSKIEDKAIRFKAMHLLAQVEMNDGKTKAAAELFEDLIKNAPNEEFIESAYRSLTILYIEENSWTKVHELLDQNINLIAKEKISAEYEGFALFWNGVAAWKLGKTKLAELSFGLAANRYVSTYYGAVSHYFLEKVSNKRLQLSSTGIKKIDLGKIFNELSEKNKARVDAILVLTTIGDQGQVACELDHLTWDEKSSNQALAVSIIKSLNAFYLDGIIIYNGIDKEYRESLPLGLEKLLYPLEFKKYVELYSAKNRLDRNLVFGLIRQESVFNPLARSWVGARGLMQLMPSTAKAIARSLPKSVVPSKKRRKIYRKVRNRRTLYHEEINIILGTNYLSNLLDEFKSVSLSLASYNAGPTTVRKWQKNLKSDKMLTFIEQIPYKETRKYVKLIWRNYFYYNYWYGMDPMGGTLMNELTDFLNLGSTISSPIATRK